MQHGIEKKTDKIDNLKKKRALAEESEKTNVETPAVSTKKNKKSKK